MARRRRDPVVSVGEVFVWLLFFALLAPAGFVGWAIGHYTAGGTHTRTVTVSAPTTAATSTTTSTTAPTTTAATSTAAPVATTASAAPTAAAAAQGKAVFTANGCGACHAFAPAGSTGTIGPNLATQPALDAKKTNLSLAAFLRRCILNPYAYIPTGYARGVMPNTFGKSLNKTQLDQLVAFITSGEH